MLSWKLVKAVVQPCIVAARAHGGTVPDWIVLSKHRNEAAATRWLNERRAEGLADCELFIGPAGAMPARYAAADEPQERFIREARERATVKAEQDRLIASATIDANASADQQALNSMEGRQDAL